MANWVKKINKSVGSDIGPTERLLEGVILQPSGMMGGLMARSLGGLVGSAVAATLRTDANGNLVTDQGIAAGFPDDTLILGLTDQRLLGWSWAKMTGKPKNLVVSIPRSDLLDVEIEKKTATYTFLLVFADGTAKAYEAPKMNNSTEEFVAALRA
jgi:hypothetical protein